MMAMMANLSALMAPSMMGMAVGSMVGRMAARAFGQYDLPIPRSDNTLLIVPANLDRFADEWSVPPFSGLERDGFVWGRGALDMKGQVAAEAVAVATLAREGWRGAGDLILCAVADEEVGDDWGLSWLVQEHPDLVRADYVLNEGGGERIEHRGRVAYTVGVGEKRCAAFAVTVHGKSGHASTTESSACTAPPPSWPRWPTSSPLSARTAQTLPSSSAAAAARTRSWPPRSSPCWAPRSPRPSARPRRR